MNIRKFLEEDNKLDLLQNKWRQLYQGIVYPRKFGQFGKKSMLVCPDRILGKKYIYIGNNVSILHHVRLESWGGLYIGDGTSMEECCHIIAADKLVIGKNCVFSAGVYISDCSHQYKSDRRIMEQELQIKPTKIGDGCFIGIGAKIMPGVCLGNFCVVGANAVVTHDVPEKAIVAGVPARIIGYNE